MNVKAEWDALAHAFDKGPLTKQKNEDQGHALSKQRTNKGVRNRFPALPKQTDKQRCQTNKGDKQRCQEPFRQKHESNGS